MYKIIQHRIVQGNPEVSNEIGQESRIKDAKGQAKMAFNSTMDMLIGHEMYEYWDDFDYDKESLTFNAYDIDRKVLYGYRVTVEEG